jgi:ATP-binding cassette, subfamily A (ABC1), member 3
MSGAGKTTTLQMLTAEFPPTSGDATLAGFSVSTEPQKTRRRIGYCPQFDAHFAQLSGRNHVELYASIKGIPAAFVKEAAALKLKEVGLSEYDSDRLCANYSGGMRRRLSFACATIGQPQILFLDECTTGVDPVARREIWELISDMVSSGPEEEKASVILTTHSMEECEALCPRIGIMANGRLRCLGSAQHLKNKFGQGFQLELKTKIVDHTDDDFIRNAGLLASFMSDGAMDVDGGDTVVVDVSFNEEQTKGALAQLAGDSFLSSLVNSDPHSVGFGIWKDAVSPVGVTLDALAAFATIELRMRNIANFVSEQFPVHVLRERQDTKARYEVSAEGLRISAIFAAVESQKDALHLADYGVSQTSLEQVFNMHAAEAEKLKQGRDDR